MKHSKIKKHNPLACSFLALVFMLGFAINLTAAELDKNAIVDELYKLPTIMNLTSKDQLNEALLTLVKNITKKEKISAAKELLYTDADIVSLRKIQRESYLQIFTAEELKAMLAFYSSAEGASVMYKMPQLRQALAPALTTMQRDKMQKIIASVQPDKTKEKDNKQ